MGPHGTTKRRRSYRADQREQRRWHAFKKVRRRARMRAAKLCDRKLEIEGDLIGPSMTRVSPSARACASQGRGFFTKSDGSNASRMLTLQST